MIPAGDDYAAVFERDLTDHHGDSYRERQERPIVAWADDGGPLVVGMLGLVQATQEPGFTKITRKASPIVAVVPGGGWMVERTDDRDMTWTGPVVAWAVTANGGVRPLWPDLDAQPVGVSPVTRTYQVWHPRQTEPERIEDEGNAPGDER